MTFLGWMALTAGVMLLMALASSYLRNLPISTSSVYLAIGITIGPVGFGLASFDVVRSAYYVERVTELAVIVALFVGGLRLRRGWSDPAWHAAVLLAGPVMVISIAGIAAIAHLAFGMPLALAMLLGAILAPTDPVLAGSVTVNDAADCDRMRYGLSGEAGLNDGTAFPFVMLALGWAVHDGAGTWLVEWAAYRLIYAVLVALVLGYVLGKAIGRLAIRLRSRQRDTTAPSDLLALALIGVAYVGAELIGAWGFLAVFAAGVGLRGAELHAVAEHPHPEAPDLAHDEHPPAEALVPASVDTAEMGEPAVAAGVLVFETLSFGDTVERLVEVALIVIVGIALVDHWDPRALAIAGALFVVIRPLAAQLILRATPASSRQRWLIGWFGIRGVGSLYYLGYALGHGVTGAGATELVELTISVIAISVVVHGITTTPLIRSYERMLERTKPAADAQSSSVAARS
ncbi:MAG: sodium:proton antiporter [Deltaproteobacteria bacterium]|nr:sodium:proton antiporter [Deltaproteobacteria bacterium]MDQ3300264.1 sodium:proton antiporter [Myxococcota bacterium]